jgi:hypothetical protein
MWKVIRKNQGCNKEVVITRCLGLNKQRGQCKNWVIGDKGGFCSEHSEGVFRKPQCPRCNKELIFDLPNGWES